MTVKELIEALSKIEDSGREVLVAAQGSDVPFRSVDTIGIEGGLINPVDGAPVVVWPLPQNAKFGGPA